LKQEYYELDESGIDYVITSATKKWREFKADLKMKYFDETLSFEELIATRDERVKESDWEWLITYWMSPEAEVRANLFLIAFLRYKPSLHCCTNEFVLLF
jgi:hypothetical protein